MTRLLKAIALLILLLITAFLLAGCGKKESATYVLTGKIVIVNECNNRQVSIPTEVRVHALLDSDIEPNRSGSADTVQLAFDPAEPAAAKKIGTYRISVTWQSVPGKPAIWERPRVLVGNQPVCRVIPCEEKQCEDVATEADIPLAGPVTNYDIRVVCNCVEE